MTETLGICFFGVSDALAQTGFVCGFSRVRACTRDRAVFCAAGGVIVNLLPLPGILKLIIYTLLLYAWQRIFLKISPGEAAGCTAVSVTVMQACFGLVGAAEGMTVLAALQAGVFLRGGLIIALGNLLPVGLYCLLTKRISAASGQLYCGRDIKAAYFLPESAIVVMTGSLFLSTADTGERGLPLFAAACGGVILWAADFFDRLAVRRMCGMLYDLAEQRRNELSACASVRHDLKNHLLVLGRLISGGEYERAGRYISGLGTDIAYAGNFFTGSAVLDALLCDKLSGLPAGMADCKVSINGLEKVSDRDLCVIFGNILDNAVSGCSSPGSPGELCEGAFIDLRTVSGCGGMLIECRNSCVSGEFTEGTGIGNIRSAAAKYGGAVTVCAEGNVFITRVMLWV